MYVVALTGGIGSGKTEATNAFSALGIPIVDLDTISHQLTSANTTLVKVIASAFGDAFITSDGVLNRSKMRTLIFNDTAARDKLNAIIHPAIQEEALKQLQTFADAPYIILAIPLLIETSPYLAAIDRILTIDCDEDTQIQRVMKRSQLKKAEIERIIASQPSRQSRLAMSDDVIKNEGNLEELRQKVDKLHQKYIKTCIVNKTIS